MAALNPYRHGTQALVWVLVDGASADISTGDFLFGGTAGYVQQAAAGEKPIGIAQSSVTSPASDGLAAVLMDVSTLSVYEYSPDAGTVTQGLVNTTMDVGGPQTVNIDASTDDILVCREVDVANNTVSVSLIPTPLGVV